jgi:hypothetical protein
VSAIAPQERRLGRRFLAIPFFSREGFTPSKGVAAKRKEATPNSQAKKTVNKIGGETLLY